MRFQLKAVRNPCPSIWWRDRRTRRSPTARSTPSISTRSPARTFGAPVAATRATPPDARVRGRSGGVDGRGGFAVADRRQQAVETSAARLVVHQAPGVGALLAGGPERTDLRRRQRQFPCAGHPAEQLGPGPQRVIGAARTRCAHVDLAGGARRQLGSEQCREDTDMSPDGTALIDVVGAQRRPVVDVAGVDTSLRQEVTNDVADALAGVGRARSAHGRAPP